MYGQEKKIFPACRKLLPIIGEKINFLGGAVFKKNTAQHLF
jgi:hypothetical protein